MRPSSLHPAALNPLTLDLEYPCRSLHNAVTDDRLLLSPHRRPQRDRSGLMELHPRRTRLHAASVLLPRRVQRALASGRQTGLWALDAGYGVSGGGEGEAEAAVRFAVG